MNNYLIQKLKHIIKTLSTPVYKLIVFFYRTTRVNQELSLVNPELLGTKFRTTT